ncbi:MAG: cation diffusion facilitator family transporter [Acidiferrobacterales bacterium]
MATGSKKAVVIAIVANAIVTVLKFIAAVVTGSASMMNEAIHSVMDTANQGFLFRGLIESERPADETYAFGHGQKKYLWNLWSAIGLFSIGSGLGLAHAWHAWQKLDQTGPMALVHIFGWQLPSIWISFSVLLIAFILEGYSFLVAAKEFLRRMRADGVRNPLTYLGESDDPTLVAVVLEDSVAMLGVCLAATGIGLAALTGDVRWDIGFSVIIALLLAGIAIFLGGLNMRYLVDIRDPEAEEEFKKVIDDHWDIERYHDLRTIVIDEKNTVLVAEIELREEAVIVAIQIAADRIEAEIKSTIPGDRENDPEVQQYIATRAVAQATLERTEQIIDEVVQRVKKIVPRVSHATIEVEGIASPARKDGAQ